MQFMIRIDKHDEEPPQWKSWSDKAAAESHFFALREYVEDGTIAGAVLYAVDAVGPHEAIETVNAGVRRRVELLGKWPEPFVPLDLDGIDL